MNNRCQICLKAYNDDEISTSAELKIRVQQHMDILQSVREVKAEKWNEVDTRLIEIVQSSQTYKVKNENDYLHRKKHQSIETLRELIKTLDESKYMCMIRFLFIYLFVCSTEKVRRYEYQKIELAKKKQHILELQKQKQQLQSLCSYRTIIKRDLEANSCHVTNRLLEAARWKVCLQLFVQFPVQVNPAFLSGGTAAAAAAAAAAGGGVDRRRISSTSASAITSLSGISSTWSMIVGHTSD